MITTGDDMSGQKKTWGTSIRGDFDRSAADREYAQFAELDLGEALEAVSGGAVTLQNTGEGVKVVDHIGGFGRSM